jgi:hypothetical protein
MRADVMAASQRGQRGLGGAEWRSHRGADPLDAGQPAVGLFEAAVELGDRGFGDATDA